jgi:hypothetical protein
MFVRGLQAAYNQYTPALGISVPHGDVLLFGLCCGQIMFAWLLSPETIPREYANWIQGVSGVPPTAVSANRTAVRNNLITAAPIQRALATPGVTPRNTAILENMLMKVNTSWKPDYHIPCALLHPWVDSCIMCNTGRFFTRFRTMLPVYGALHLIPMLVFRRHQVMKTPLKMLTKALWGITRSCSFLSLFIVIYQCEWKSNCISGKNDILTRSALLHALADDGQPPNPRVVPRRPPPQGELLVHRLHDVLLPLCRGEEASRRAGNVLPPPCARIRLVGRPQARLGPYRAVWRDYPRRCGHGHGHGRVQAQT